MASDKWIKDLQATTRLKDAARRVLGVRFEVIRKYLGLVMLDAEKDANYVHQLRVGTRRAQAALTIFSDCLPRKLKKSAQRTLRDLRRAAGDAREWDVFLMTISKELKHAGGSAHSGLDSLIGFAVAKRLSAQTTLTASIPDPIEFENIPAELINAVREPKGNHRRLVDLARPTLLQLIQQIDRTAALDLKDYDILHKLRIAGKKLRYAMEVFAGCFPEEFREVYYAAIEKMQGILGRVNDSRVAIGRLAMLSEKMSVMIPDEWKRYQIDLDRLVRFHHERLPKEKEAFIKWWNHWRREKNGKSGLLAMLNNGEQRH